MGPAEPPHMVPAGTVGLAATPACREMAGPAAPAEMVPAAQLVPPVPSAGTAGTPCWSATVATAATPAPAPRPTALALAALPGCSWVEAD